MHLCVVLYFTAFQLAAVNRFYTLHRKRWWKTKYIFPPHRWINYYLLFIQHVVFLGSMRAHTTFLSVIFSCSFFSAQNFFYLRYLFFSSCIVSPRLWHIVPMKSEREAGKYQAQRRKEGGVTEWVNSETCVGSGLEGFNSHFNRKTVTIFAMQTRWVKSLKMKKKWTFFESVHF